MNPVRNLYLLGLVLASSGCSWIFMTAPPEGVPPAPAAARATPCTESQIAPAVDLALAGVAFGHLGSEEHKAIGHDVEASTYSAIANLVIGAALVGSGVRGILLASECRSLHRQSDPPEHVHVGLSTEPTTSVGDAPAGERPLEEPGAAAPAPTTTQVDRSSAAPATTSPEML